MRRVARHLLLRLLVMIASASLVFAVGTASAQSGAVRYDRATLDSMLAPIALYPDALLSHVLMAATYPEEVEDAANWLRARPGLSGDAAVRTSADQDWDPSVRSLLAFPMVLETMAGHLRWTGDLGNAFLHQRAEVMDTVQALRRRAYEAGTLRSNEAVQIVVTAAGIVIEQASPETAYVPHYDPRVAYGGWWWPSRPPMHWPRWHGYVDPLPRGHYLTWGPGIHIGSGFFFGGFAWPRHEVRVVHVHSHYYPRHSNSVVVHREARPGVWRHDDRRRRRDRDGDHHDRRDWRHDNDRRGPAATRSVIESREARRDDLRDRRGPDRNGDGVPDRARRTDRNNDGVPDRARRTDRDNDGVPDRARRTDRNNDGVPDRARRPDRDGDGRPDRNRGAIDRDGSDRRHGTSDVRRNDRSDHREQGRSQRPDRNDARARAPREAPRAAQRVERGPPPNRNAEPEREFRRPPRARVDPGNRD
ncbi:MAG: DUF3300 domain-containing protein [Betaproteobacteria bacterium]|nr:DUF3300 domain-containing protein [Betaproteobacteria bacterium]